MNHRHTIVGRTIGLIGCVLAFTWTLTSSAVALPPASDDQDGESHGHHFDTQPHTRSDDRTRFTTNRSSDVVLDLPSEEDAFIFAVFGDRTGGPADGVKILAEAVRDTNLIEPDFVMTVGDLVAGYNQREQWMPQMREFKGIMDRLLCPWFPVAGNHDIYWRGPDRPAEEHEGDYEMHFGPLWYAFEHKDCWFIVLYSDEADPVTGERNFGKPASQVMSEEQFDWLKETLGRSADAQHVFVFLHHPRWLGGKYGDDWEKVHDVLVEAGNVRAVFAGHIHYMRYDGPRDGIEYVTLATVGGAQGGSVPRAGHLHHFDLVTVRKKQIALSAVPVGQVLDVRAISGEVALETRRLAATQPIVAKKIVVEGDGSAEAEVRAVLHNPASRPIEVEVVPASEDSRWRFRPDHLHQTIEPGGRAELMFHAEHAGGGLDSSFRGPELVVGMDYLAEGARYSIPAHGMPLPLKMNLDQPELPRTEQALQVNGRAGFARVPSDMLHVPDGPMTVECWFKADGFGERTGLITKTESSEYGIFVNDGIPGFSIFLGDRYAGGLSSAGKLSTEEWHHVAGVFDGQHVRLYVDGALVSSVDKSGIRKTNGLPFLIGADVDDRGNATSFFDGAIDAVRISTVARYEGDEFVPTRRFESDAATALLLNMDAVIAERWLFDESPAGAHPTVHGGTQVTDG